VVLASQPISAVNAEAEVDNISCPSTGFCVGVGTSRGNSDGTLPWIVTQDDGTWTSQNGPVPADASTTNASFAVSSLSCASVALCVAVGTYVDDNNVQQGLLLEYASNAWHAVTAPVPTDAATDAQATNNSEHTYVNDVSCWAAGDCVAVGKYMLTSGHYMTMGLHFNGSTWSASSVEPPSNASTSPDPTLTTVACDSSGTCVAFGGYAPSGDSSLEADVTTDAGGTWSSAEAPVPVGSSSNPAESISAAACPTTGLCTAVGNYVDGNGYFQAVVLQQVSDGWSATAVPIPGEDTTQQPWVSINALSCPAVGSCVADGTYQDDRFQTFGALLQQTSLGWTAQQAPLPNDWDEGTPDVTLGADSISCAAAGDCTAVGTYKTEPSTDTVIGDAGMVLTESNGSWDLATQEAWPFGYVPGETGSPMAGGLSAVSCATTESCWALGSVKQEVGGSYELVAESISTTESSGTPASTTSSLPANEQITIGHANSDAATVTGTAIGGSPTGTVQFYECGPTAVATACTSQGNPLGAPMIIAPGAGDTATASGPSVTPGSLGFWCFAAYYSGDTNYQASSNIATDGCFDVTQGSESTTTSLGLSAASVTYGGETTETFSGSVTGQPGDGYPEGSVTINNASTALCSTTLGAGSGDSVSYSCQLTASALAAETYSSVSATYVPTTQSSSNSNLIYTASSSAPPTSLVVSPATQTVAFTSSAPANAVVGGPTYLPRAVGGVSGNPVVISVDHASAAVCAISGGVVRFTGAGTCILHANQVGTGNYRPAPQATQSVLVAKLVITTRSLPVGAPKVSYSATLVAVGGNRPYAWSVSSGRLPPGLRLEASTGSILGKPSRTDSGIYTFVVRVLDKKTAAKGHAPTQDVATRVLSIAML
jgi:hypothetical protein